jgi:glycosyltransferase involved in cell wall biosynthesis
VKILRILSSGYEEGGVENGVEYTNQGLRKRGHEVRTITSDSRPDLPHFSDYEFAKIPDKGIKKFIYTAFNLDSYRLTKFVVKDYKPDVVTIHTMQQTSASILFSIKNIPTLVCVHGPETYTKTLLPWRLADNDFKNKDYDIKKLTSIGKLHYLYFKYICGIIFLIGFRNVDRFVAFSRYTESMLKRDGIKNEVMYIPNGVNLFKPRNKIAGPPIVAYAGRLESYKGVDNLIRAYAEAKNSIPKLKLVIAGQGRALQSLRNLAFKLKVDNDVSFVGHLSKDEIEDFYGRSSVIVMPSEWPETFGKVGVEAMSIGRPVIATDVGGVRDWLVDGFNGFLVRPGSQRDIARKIIATLIDKKEYNRLSDNAKKTSRQFGMDKFTENLEVLLNEIKHSKAV